ncbi:MAG: amino acid permease [Candidatus Aminicenantales bacterium]
MDKQGHSLPRVLGLWDIVGIVVGGVIGSGIFLVPSTIAAGLGAPLVILAVWVVGGLLSFFGALSFAELGAAIPEAGGIYVYLREAYGSMISFLFGWTLFLVIDAGAIATLAVAFSSKYLTHFFVLSPLLQKLISAGLILFLMLVNYIGTRWGANLQNLLTAIKFVALAGICGIVFIFGKGNPANFVTPAPQGLRGLLGPFGIALVASLWAYKGWESATYSAGETKNPQRNLPMGLFIGMAVVIALYLAANLAYMWVMPTSAIAGSARVAADAMNSAIGPIAASIVSFIILFSIMGAANQNILCSPRVYFAMAKDGLFFKKLAAVHPTFKTPHISIIAIGVWSIILSLSGTFEQLFTYVVFGQWIFFGLTVAAVIILRRKKPDLPRPYKTWGYPVTPIVFILAALYISINSLLNQFGNAVAGLVIILMGLSPFVYWQHKIGKKIGAFYATVFLIGLLAWDAAVILIHIPLLNFLAGLWEKIFKTSPDPTAWTTILSGVTVLANVVIIILFFSAAWKKRRAS